MKHELDTKVRYRISVKGMVLHETTDKSKVDVFLKKLDPTARKHAYVEILSGETADFHVEKTDGIQLLTE